MSQSRISRMEMPSADTPKPAKSHTSSAKVVRTAGLPRGAPRKHLQPRRAYGMTYKPPISLGCKLTQGHPRKAGTSTDIHQLFVVPARRRNCFNLKLSSSKLPLSAIVFTPTMAFSDSQMESIQQIVGSQRGSSPQWQRTGERHGAPRRRYVC